MSQSVRPRLRPSPARLAACIAALCAAAGPAAHAAGVTWPVTSCLDDGSPETLRGVIGAATTQTGDIVDLSGLAGANACAGSKITLSTGAIAIQQDALTIKGPGAAQLQIDASGLSSGFPGDYRVFSHYGAGTLGIEDLGVTGGHVYHVAIPSRGGCIYSKANVTLTHSTVSACSATNAGSDRAFGGGIYAKGELRLKYSTISGNVVSSGYNSVGGGADAMGYMLVAYSTIDGNKAYGAARAGGLFGGGSVTIAASTISNNFSADTFGGIDVFAPLPAENVFVMVNSTVSNNVAANLFGGVFSNSGTAKLYGTTIAFNYDLHGFSGAVLSGADAPMTATLQSTLISNNTYYGHKEADFSVLGSVTFNAAPANNLIRVTSVAGLPADTKVGDCPLLGPLRNNGGLTLTHALSSRSPAIDTGNDSSLANYDQRGRAAANGAADYPRLSGPLGNPIPYADIGAYEVQQDDVIFDSGFEGCVAP